MDQKTLSAILRITKKTGGKNIIVENGKPSFVIMNFEEYERLLEDSYMMEEEDSVIDDADFARETDENEFIEPKSINRENSQAEPYRFEAKNQRDEINFGFDERSIPFEKETSETEEPLYYFNEEKRD